MDIPIPMVASIETEISSPTALFASIADGFEEDLIRGDEVSISSHDSSSMAGPLHDILVNPVKPTFSAND